MTVNCVHASKCDQIFESLYLIFVSSRLIYVKNRQLLCSLSDFSCESRLVKEPWFSIRPPLLIFFGHTKGLLSFRPPFPIKLNGEQDIKLQHPRAVTQRFQASLLRKVFLATLQQPKKKVPGLRTAAQQLSKVYWCDAASLPLCLQRSFSVSFSIVGYLGRLLPYTLMCCIHVRRIGVYFFPLCAVHVSLFSRNPFLQVIR